MPTIKRDWFEITKNVINEAHNKLQEDVVTPLYAELPDASLQNVAPEFFKKMRELSGFANEISIMFTARSAEAAEMPGALIPLFKALFLKARLAKAKELDQQKSKTTNSDVIAALDGHLNVYEDVTRQDWFQKCVPDCLLSLSDILTLERVERLDVASSPPARQYDEKFHILQSPTLFLSDLNYYRGKCGMRMLPVSIAFLDIDKFKDFNSELGETKVDRNILPLFMRAVEAHIYGHGYAYRYGGDEYAILMPNADADLALAFVNGLRERVRSLHFRDTAKTITVSAGLCVADQNCHLTDGELLQRAERAKNFAKGQGRDCVAGYTSTLFDDGDLHVFSPVPARASPWTAF